MPCARRLTGAFGMVKVTASTTSPGGVDRDGVPALESFHSRSHFLYPSRDLVPQRERRGIILPVACGARYDREVGVAQSGAGDFDDYLAGPGMRLRYLLELWLCLG